MPEQGRVGDQAEVPSDSHGSICCAHGCVGPGTDGSPDVLVNGMPALRLGDPGVHSGCCGDNTWKAVAGSSGVFINGKKAHRKGDATQHCGGSGKLIEGSGDVIVGEKWEGEVPKPPPPYEGAFILRDEITGAILKEVDYVIKTASGRFIKGKTDGAGKTRLVTSDKLEELVLEIPDWDSNCEKGGE